MERKFVLSCCSTVDLPYAYMTQRDIPVLFYHYVWATRNMWTIWDGIRRPCPGFTAS